MVSTDKHGLVIKIVGDWADSSGLSKFECSKYHLDIAVVGSCFELGQAGKVPEYFLMAELSALANPLSSSFLHSQECRTLVSS